MTSLYAGSALAAATINFGEDKSITVGLGFRAAFTSAEDSAPNGKSRSSDFDIYSTRLYTSASLNKYIKGTLNIEGNDGAESSFGGAKLGEQFRVYDAIAQFEFRPEFNIWAGRMLTPSDRSNLNGPYYLSTWLYPGLTARYPGQVAGRDTGVTVWGKLFDKRLVYSAGAFEGHNNVQGASSQDDNLLYAGRLQYDFWEANLVPAYYTASTFYGKEVLSVAVAGQYQKNGVGSAGAQGDYLGYNLDVLMEKNIGIGYLNLEGALYKFDSDGKSDVSAALLPGTPSGTANVGGIQQGKAYLAGAALLFPQQVGWGRLQPYVRYQKFDADSTSGDGVTSFNVAASDSKQYDYGVNYVIDGHNARISATYTRNEFTAAQDIDKFTLGLQLQF